MYIYIWDMYGEIYEIKESIWKKYRTYMGKYGETKNMRESVGKHENMCEHIGSTWEKIGT